MLSPEINATQLLEEAARVARRARRQALKRLIWLASLTLTVGIALSIFITRQLEEGRKTERRLENVSRELDEGFKGNQYAGPGPDINRIALLAGLTGKRREAVRLALDLYDKRVPFKWGGKDPHDGLDTSGYVAFVLSQVGIIKGPAQYWSGRLRSEFETSTIKSVTQLKPGDVVFEENKACWIVLTNGTLVGMIPQGMTIAEAAKLGSDIAGYGPIPYERVDGVGTGRR